MTSIIRLLGLGSVFTIPYFFGIEGSKPELHLQKAEKDSVLEYKSTLPLPAYTPLLDKQLCDGFSDPFNKGKFTGFYLSGSSKARIQFQVEESENSMRETWIIKAGGPLPVVHAMADGTIIDIDDTSVTIFHRFLENGKVRSINMKYSGLQIDSTIQKGIIQKGSHIGILKEARITLESNIVSQDQKPYFFHSPSWYAEHYHDLTVPHLENDLLIAVKQDYALYHFQKGELKGKYDICLGQEPNGHKEKEGDNRTPEGEYRITEKEKGPFVGGTGPWLGDRWMHFSYPNRYDAHAGFQRGIITEKQYLDITSVDLQKGKTNSYTKLGGRVGIHGWNGEFEADGTQNLTWGCVCMQNEDIIHLFDKIPMQTKLIILP